MKIAIEEIKNWIDLKVNLKDLAYKLTKVGFESYSNEDVIDVTIPYNRQDCVNLFGLLNEISAVLNLPIKNYKIKSGFKEINKIKLKINDNNFYKKYYGRIINNINIKTEIPNYIKHTLLENGFKFNLNVIDIINYVSIITGQPLHAYDLCTIKKNIVLDKLKCTKTIETLNNNTLTLLKNDYLITNGENELSIPGIIGCKYSMISEKTRSIYLESALFDFKKINNNSILNNIETYSYNLSKNNIDSHTQRTAIDFATYLIVKHLGGTYSKTTIKQKKNNSVKQYKTINLLKKNIDKIIGINIKTSLINKIFKRLKFKFEKGKSWQIRIPIYRKDIIYEEDIIEDISRYIGYDNIDSKPYISIQQDTKIEKKDYSLINEIKATLTSIGYNEIITYSFVNSKVEYDINDKVNIVHLKNPLSEDQNVMRSSLLQGLIEKYSYNIKRNQTNLHLFELGKVFTSNINNPEKLSLGGICSENQYFDHNGIANKNSLFSIKNIIEQILNLTNFDISQQKIDHTNYNYFNNNESAVVKYNEKIICKFGTLNDIFLKKFDIKSKLYYFEIDLDDIDIKKVTPYSKFSKFPVVKRDLSILINKDISYIKIRAAIENLKFVQLKNINMLNIYTCENFGENIKSITLTLIFQDKEKSLKDNEVNLLMNKIIEELDNKFKITIRGI